MIFACFLSALSLIFTANKKRAERELGGSRSAVKSFCCRVLFADSRCGRYGCFFFIAVLKTLKDGAWVIRGFAQRIVNPVAHFQSCLERGFLAAVLAVGKIFGELIPLAADAQSPSLEGSGLVCIAGNVTLGHGCDLLFVVVWRGSASHAAKNARYISLQQSNFQIVSKECR